MLSLVLLAGGGLLLGASVGLLWLAKPVAGLPAPFMRRRGMQVIVPYAILLGLCGGTTMVIHSIGSLIM